MLVGGCIGAGGVGDELPDQYIANMLVGGCIGAGGVRAGSPDQYIANMLVGGCIGAGGVGAGSPDKYIADMLELVFGLTSRTRLHQASFQMTVSLYPFSGQTKPQSRQRNLKKAISIIALLVFEYED